MTSFIIKQRAIFLKNWSAINRYKLYKYLVLYLTSFLFIMYVFKHKDLHQLLQSTSKSITGATINPKNNEANLASDSVRPAKTTFFYYPKNEKFDTLLKNGNGSSISYNPTESVEVAKNKVILERTTDLASSNYFWILFEESVGDLTISSNASEEIFFLDILGRLITDKIPDFKIENSAPVSITSGELTLSLLFQLLAWLTIPPLSAMISADSFYDAEILLKLNGATRFDVIFSWYLLSFMTTARLVTPPFLICIFSGNLPFKLLNLDFLVWNVLFNSMLSCSVALFIGTAIKWPIVAQSTSCLLVLLQFIGLVWVRTDATVGLRSLFVPGSANIDLGLMYHFTWSTHRLATPLYWKFLLSSATLSICSLIFSIFFFLVCSKNFSLRFASLKDFLRCRSIYADDLLPHLSEKFTDRDVYKEYENVQERKDSELVCAVRSLSKTFKDGKTAVRNVTFSAEPNTIFGLLGPNGAGKTTVAQIICGMLVPSSGQVLVDGHQVHLDTEINKHLVTLCPQHDIFFPENTVFEFILFVVRMRGAKPSEEFEIARKLTTRMYLLGYADFNPREMSGGLKRILSLAAAFAGPSKVSFLDEPTTGLDPEVQQMMWDIILNERKNRVIILSTHSMREAETLSDVVTIMAHGILKCFGTPHALKERFGGKLSIKCFGSQNLYPSALESEVNALSRFSFKVVESRSECISLSFNGSLYDFSNISKAFAESVRRIGVEDFGISQPSFEQVFVNVANNEDAEA